MNEPTLSLRMLTSAQAAGVISEATRTRFSPRLSSSADATRRNSSWVPVSSSAATPTRQAWASPVLLQPVLMPAEVSRPGSNKPRGRRHQRWRQAEHAVEDRNQRGHYEGPPVPVGLSTPAWAGKSLHRIPGGAGHDVVGDHVPCSEVLDEDRLVLPNDSSRGQVPAVASAGEL